MYHEFYGLKQAPFKITPDTRLFFPGGSRGEILEALVYAISSGEGIVKVVGEVGSGKTMLCRMLEVRLPDQVEIVYLPNPSLTPEDILHNIALEMGVKVDPAANRIHVMQDLHQCLLERHADNRRVVVFVEEAQAMPLETLEEIRLLSNLETQQDKLLQIVLFGQPELDRNLNVRSIRQLRERITHSFSLPPLTGDDVKQYVRFRLNAVGYRGPDMFEQSAYKAIAGASRGLTRRVNILADKSLLAAFAENTHSVSKRHVRKAIADSEMKAAGDGLARRVLPVAATVAAVAVLVGIGTSGVLNPVFEKVSAAWNVSDEPAQTPGELFTGEIVADTAPVTESVESDIVEPPMSESTHVEPVISESVATVSPASGPFEADTPANRLVAESDTQSQPLQGQVERVDDTADSMSSTMADIPDSDSVREIASLTSEVVDEDERRLAAAALSVAEVSQPDTITLPVELEAQVQVPVSDEDAPDQPGSRRD